MQNYIIGISGMHEVEQQKPQIYYLMSFNLFSQTDIQVLCAYKQFVENTIIQLGEDWRIQSGLLSQQITSIFTQSMSAEADSHLNTSLQFNIFNQFLVPFLKNKLGQQRQACQLPDSTIQQTYSESLKIHFQINSKIIDSLTFKTLSLGFCIKAVDMWVKNFNDIGYYQNPQFLLQPLGILYKQVQKKKFLKKPGEKSSIGTSTIRNNLSNIDLGSCQLSNSEIEQSKNKKFQQMNEKKWVFLKNLQAFTQNQLQGISNGLNKAKTSKFSKMQVISSFAVNIHELNTKHKKVRVLSINNQFYRNAFIIWLIFNIKLFFSITFEQYMTYFKKLIKKWDSSLQGPLKKFYIIIEKQWNLLLKDYSVALHDDLEVLKGLIIRVRNSLAQIWKATQTQIYKKLSH